MLPLPQIVFEGLYRRDGHLASVPAESRRHPLGRDEGDVINAAGSIFSSPTKISRHEALLRCPSPRRSAHQEQSGRPCQHLPDGRCRPGSEGKPEDPERCYNIERVLRRVLAGKGEVLLWGACMDARGLADAEMMAGARRTARPSE